MPPAAAEVGVTGLARRVLARVDAHLFGPVLAWPLALFRIAFSGVLLCYYIDRFWYLEELFGDSPARLPNLSVDEASAYSFAQAFHAGPLPDPVAWGLAALFLVAVVALGVGYRARLAAGVLAGWLLFRILFEWSTAFSIDRSSFLVMLVLAASPCARVLSVEAWRRGESAWRDVQVSGWATRTLQWLLLSWYVLAGLAKLAGHWDLIVVDSVLFSQLQGWYQNELAWWMLTHVPLPVFGVLQQASLYFEIYAPVLLVPARLRPFGMLIGVGMHVSVAALMIKLWFFSAEMICFYLLFLPLTSWPFTRSPRAPA